uniref:Uncharacterized protein n=1 Tax=Eutreptiella gymnastica TaxID=73025 RepID=A0A7S1NUE0_9EUGL
MSSPVVWLRQNKVPQLFNELIKALVKEKPGEPYTFLIARLAQKKGHTPATEEEQHAAATKIQCMKRGKDARQKVGQKKEERTKQNQAATKIQSVKRGGDARQEVKKRRAERGSATEPASSSDAVVKASVADEVCPAVPIALHILDEGYVNFQEMREGRAATRIQALHRGNSSRAAVVKKRQEKLEQDTAASKIQALHRGRQARARVENIKAGKGDPAGAPKDEAAVGEPVQDNDCTPLVPVVEHILDGGYLCFTDMQQNGAAIKIQSLHRGRTARKEVIAKRQAKVEVDNAAAKIQALQRGRMDRKKVDEMKAARSTA